MFIDERNRNTKNAGKRLCTASPEPVRSAAKAPSAPKPSDTSKAKAKSTSTPNADEVTDREIDGRLDDAHRHDPAELASEQGNPAHRRQRKSVEKASLDVA